MSDRIGWNSSDMILAVLGGAAVGAGVAYLTTTKTGKQRRAEIGEMVEHGRERMNEYVATGRDKARAFPAAARAAGSAARESFVEAMKA